MVEKTYSYFTTDKAFIDYINDKWDGSFSRFVNSVKKKELHLIKNNKKKNFFQNFTRNILMLGIGAIFIFLSLSINGLLGMIMVLLLGVFFIISSLVSLGLEVFDHWKIL